MEDRDIDVTLEASGFVAELRRLADALESGTPFTIHVDGEDVTVPEDARLSVAHEREDGTVELEFQVTWSMPQTGSVAEETAHETVADGITGTDGIDDALSEPVTVDTDTAEHVDGDAGADNQAATGLSELAPENRPVTTDTI